VAESTTIAVIGAGSTSPQIRKLARELGYELGARGATLICGGLGGVMEAAAQGAYDAGAQTVGILPGYDRRAANRFIRVPIVTGIGEARNLIVVASAQAVVALEGEGGTLSEIGFALKLGRPVVALQSWHQIAGLHRAQTPPEAAELALALATSGKT
jgi:uncharacterized protein (TIGR00725 family)